MPSANSRLTVKRSTTSDMGGIEGAENGEI